MTLSPEDQSVLQVLLKSAQETNEQVLASGEKLNKLLTSTLELRDNTEELARVVVAKFAQLTDAQTELRTSVFSKLDRMQGTIELVKEDINVNFASSHTALSNARSGRDETENLA